MSGATELLALTEAAIEPLFHTGQQTTGDGIDGSAQHVSSLPIFYPLTGCDPPSVALLTDHTPPQRAPPSSTDHTPSPLTISAHDVGSGVMAGGRNEEEGSSSPRGSRLPLTPRSTLFIHPVMSTPHTTGVTPTTLDTIADTPTPGSGQIRIKISAKKVREVPSPLAAEPQLRGVGKSAPSPLSSGSSPGTLQALSPLPLSSPSSSPSPTTYLPVGRATQPSNDEIHNMPLTATVTAHCKQSTCLAQGVMRTLGHDLSADTSLENSIVVSQSEPTVPRHSIKEKLLEQQAHEKQARFKVVQPHVIRQPLQTTAQLEKSETEKRLLHPPTNPLNVREVRGDRNFRDSKHAVKSPVEPGTDLTSLPVSGLPLRHLANQLASAPTSINEAFPVKPSLGSTVQADTTRNRVVRPSCTHGTLWHRQCKQFPSVSSSHAPTPIHHKTDPSSGSVSPAPEPQLPSSSSLHLPVSLPQTLGFEETVKLVASCTAAATAAAITAQRASDNEAKVVKDLARGKTVSNLASKEATKFGFDRSVNNNRYTGPLPCTRSRNQRRFRQAHPSSPPSPPSPPAAHIVRFQTEEGEERGGVFSGQYPQEETTGVKEPLVEKTTRVFTMSPQQSQPGRGLAQEEKQPTLLNNLTPHATESCKKTQDKRNYSNQQQGSPPTSSNLGNSGGKAHANGHEVHESCGSEEHTGVESHSESETDPLHKIEKMLLKVQQARRDLEEQAVLAEIQAGWKDIIPPPTADLSNPEHRVAVFLNQLRETSPATATVTQQNDNAEEVESVDDSKPLQQGKKLKGFQQPSSGSKASNLGPQKGKVHPMRGNSQRSNSKVRANKQKGSATIKEKHLERKAGARKTNTTSTSETLQEKVVTSDVKEDKGHSKPPPANPGGLWGVVPPPSLPLLHSQVQAPKIYPGMPVAGYSLPSGAVVMCDPSTGVPIAGSMQMMPPCVHMPTAIPLGPPTVIPPVEVISTPDPVAQCKSQPVLSQAEPAKVPPAPSQTRLLEDPPVPEPVNDQSVNDPPVPIQAEPVNDQPIRSHAEPAAHLHDPPVPSHADVCLQTSFSENGETAVISHIDPENSHLDSSGNSGVVSLVGNQAGTSPPNGPLTTPAQQPGEKDTVPQLSAEEMNKKMTTYLESQAAQWVTQELLTRVLAAEQSHDQSCDSNVERRLGGSLNSCSTCTTPPPRAHSPPFFTPTLPHRDTSAAADVGGEASRGVWGSGAGREGVWSDVVEVVVREVLREKVVEALREVQSHRREDEEMCTLLAEEPEDATSTGSVSNSVQPSPPPIPTPSPSPPPAHSSPPSHNNTTSQHSPGPELVTPTATPPASQRTDSTVASPPADISTPHETAEDISDLTTSESTPDSGSDAGAPPHHTTLSTPSHSPPHRAPPTPSPACLTRRENPTPSPPSLPHMTPKHISLSESSSSTSPSTTSTEAHPHHPHSLTTVTNLTTDQEISMGECTLVRPPLPGATNQLSEGEVALSPGDARWYATYATKMGRWGPHGRTNNKPIKSKVSPVVAAFLDLKNSPNSLCDTSEYSDSFQSDSNVASAGEMRIQRRHGGSGADPLDRFLAKLQSSSSETTSSTPTPPTSGDNTLSDLPSIAGDEHSLSHGEVKQKNTSTPIQTQNTRKRHSIGSVDGPASVPYHQKFPFEEGKSASPGEVRHKQNPLSGKRRDKKSDLSVSFAQSEGEVHAAVRRRPQRREERSKQTLPSVMPVASPGELRIRNKTRDGIDVISISKSSSPSCYSYSSRKEISTSITSQDTTPHTPSDPSTPGRRLRVTDELRPARIVTVASSFASHSDKREDELSKARVVTVAPFLTSPSGSKAVSPQLVDSTAAHPHTAEVNISPDVTQPPDLETLLQTSSSSSDDNNASPPIPPTGRPTIQSLKRVENKSQEIHETTPSPQHQLASFWDTPTPRTPHHFTSSSNKERKQEIPTEAAIVLPDTEIEQHNDKSSLLSSVDTQDTNRDPKPPSNTTETPAVPTDDEGLEFIPSPTKTQLRVSVPTATAVEEGSPLTSPAPTPSYSSDFDFSSVSQLTND